MDLAYTDTGHGRPILLLHGWSLDRTMWDRQIADLAYRGYRVVAPDLPGHGASLNAASDRSFSAMAPTALELLDELSIERPLVCGLSMGSAIAIELAIARPDRVAALLLADNAAADGAGRGPAAAQRLQRSTIDELIDWYAPLLFSSKFRAEHPEAVSTWSTQFRANDLDALADIVVSYHGRRDVRPYLGQISCPTTVVFGTEDATTPPAKRVDYEAIPPVNSIGHRRRRTPCKRGTTRTVSPADSRSSRARGKLGQHD